jgi:hypothetical protein
MRITQAARHLPVVLALLAAPGAAMAEPTAALPRYDVAAYCRKISGLSGGNSHTLRRNCLRSEAEARAALAPRWPDLPQAVRARCDRLSRSVGFGRYARLRSCVEASLSPRPGGRSGA